MRARTIPLACAVMIALLCLGAAGGDTDIEYYKAIADYYVVSYDSVVAKLLVADTTIAAEDLPVFLFVAERAQTPPMTIVEVRSRGESWDEIVKGRMLQSDIFYFMIAGDIESKTYAPIFDKFKSTPKKDWKLLQFADPEIVNLVNLRFISSHHDYSLFEIMKMRDAGKGFIEINHDVAQIKKEMIEEEKKRRKKASEAKEEEG
jgi:hypothetical protein